MDYRKVPINFRPQQLRKSIQIQWECLRAKIQPGISHIPSSFI